jgi:hypothetical protein
MATKKRNRQIAKRKVRRVLNLAIDFFKGVSGRRTNQHGYGRALSRSDLRQQKDSNE